MMIVLSNANGPKKNLDELVAIARKINIKAIEWKVEPEDISPYVSIEAGNEALIKLKIKLLNLETKVYGICLVVDFNNTQSAMFAKQCLDILKNLCGKVLRLIMKPVDLAMISDQTYNNMIGFLNSLGRYASYSAGGGGHGETTIRLAYDLLSQTTLNFTDLMRINNFLTSRSLGISLGYNQFSDLQKYTQILRECNQNELSLNHISIKEKITESKLRGIIAEAVQVYDGPLVVEVEAGNLVQIAKIINLAEDYQFDLKAYDYTKMSCPSSTARIIRALGQASLTPADDVEVGTLGTWHYTFTVGEQGIRTGGGLKMTFHHSTNWQPFQIDNPKAPNYVRVVTSGNAEVGNTIYTEDACLVIKVKVLAGNIAPGEKIELIVGDTSGGSSGSRAQTFQQNEFAFYAFVDATGLGHYFQQPNPPKIRITGGFAQRIKVIGPSIVYIGEPFEVGVRVEDHYGNTACNYESGLKVRLESKVVVDIKIVTLNDNQATRKIKGFIIKAKGRYLIEVEDNQGRVGVSNYI